MLGVPVLKCQFIPYSRVTFGKSPNLASKNVVGN